MFQQEVLCIRGERAYEAQRPQADVRKYELEDLQGLSHE